MNKDAKLPTNVIHRTPTTDRRQTTGRINPSNWNDISCAPGRIFKPVWPNRSLASIYSSRGNRWTLCANSWMSVRYGEIHVYNRIFGHLCSSFRVRFTTINHRASAGVRRSFSSSYRCPVPICGRGPRVSLARPVRNASLACPATSTSTGFLDRPLGHEVVKQTRWTETAAPSPSPLFRIQPPFIVHRYRPVVQTTWNVLFACLFVPRCPSRFDSQILNFKSAIFDENPPKVKLLSTRIFVLHTELKLGGC